MDPISTALISKALDGLHLRAAVIADNIANVNSPGFTPRKVSFEQALRAASTQGPDAIARSGAKVEVAPASGLAPTVRLDMEMADVAQTAARYSALVDLLGRQMQIHRTAIRGGQ